MKELEQCFYAVLVRREDVSACEPVVCGLAGYAERYRDTNDREVVVNCPTSELIARSLRRTHNHVDCFL